MWNQHVRYFSKKGITLPNQRDLFDVNLIALLQIILANGDNVVLGIDMNEDVRTGKLAKQLKKLGLIDLILSTHPLESPRRRSTEILLELRLTQFGAIHHWKYFGLAIDRSMTVIHLYYQMDTVSFGSWSVTSHCWVNMPLLPTLQYVPRY